MRSSSHVSPRDFLQNKIDYPFSYGVLLATNAISDAHLFLDAPRCSYGHLEMIRMHDTNSSLMDRGGGGRVAISEVTATTVIGNRENDLRTGLERLLRLEGCGVVLAASFPLVALTGTRYRPVFDSLDDAAQRPFVEVHPSLDEVNWLDGYARTLQSIAESIELDAVERREGTVGLVGYMMDRTVMEQVANLEEVRRLLGGLGLELVSTWLDGGPYDALGRVAQASTIISLPYGREAARTLASRTGAELIETDLPFGLHGTVQWVRRIAAGVHREEQADRFIEGELREAVRHLRWIVDSDLLPTQTLFLGDPYFLPPLCRLAQDLGVGLREAFACGSERHLERLQDPRTPGCEIITEAGLLDVMDLMEELKGSHERPLAITCEVTKTGWPMARDVPVMIFGFPSFGHRGIGPLPFLGFRGTLGFVQRMLQA